MFIFSIIFAVHNAITSLFTDRDTCSACKDAPLGYSLSIGSCECCDDCLRRTLVHERLAYEAIWDFLCLGTAESVELIEFICSSNDLFLGKDLSASLRKTGASSQFLHPGPLVSDPSYGEFLAYVGRRQDAHSTPMSPSSLWSTIAGNSKAKKGGKSKSKKGDSKALAPPVPSFRNPNWILPPDMLGGASIDTLPKEAIMSIMLKQEVFMTKEVFLRIIPEFCYDDYAKLRTVSPQLFDHVDVDIERWVRIGTDDTGLPMAKGCASIIDNQIDAEFSKSGDTQSLSHYKRLKELALDTSCGILRTKNISFHLLKSEYLKDHGTYYNLLYTVAIHCSTKGAKVTKVLERRKCQIHGLGYDDLHGGDDRNAVVRQSWIPVTYGLRTPSGVLTAVKPIICGITALALQAGALPKSLVNYLTSKAVLVAPSFSTLPLSVQGFLMSKFQKASLVPVALIARLVGKDVNDAAAIIFSKTALAVATPPAGKKAKQAPKPPSGGSGGGSAPTSQSKKPFPFQGYTDGQVRQLTKSYGGDFRAFSQLKKKHGLKGNLDVMKLSNFFEKGKPKFGKLSAVDIAAKCLN